MAPMRQRNRCLAALDSEDGQELLSFDGTLTNLNSWLDDLNDSEHLRDAELVTLLHTGCAISRSGRTVVSSRPHTILNSAGLLDNARFNVLNPPPLNDGFAAFFDQTKTEVMEKDPSTRPVRANASPIFLTPTPMTTSPMTTSPTMRKSE